MIAVRLMCLALACMTIATGASAYDYQGDDFASSVVNYRPGTGIGVDAISGRPFNDPAASLGRPTVDTTGDGLLTGSPNDPVTVVALYAAFRSFEVVTLGNGGELTVKFSHPVYDDPFNFFELDLTIFGNATMMAADGGGWTNGDPDDRVVVAAGFEEPGMVSVSQDAVKWIEFNDGPWADGFAPTLGRVYDSDTPAPGQVHWGAPTDPTKPLDSALPIAMLEGLTLAEVARDFYQDSAGGTSFDIGQLPLPTSPLTGLKWIQYVRVSDPPGFGTVEIDAFSDVAPSVGLLSGDASNDRTVTGADLITVQQHFGHIEPEAPSGLLLGDADDDGAVTGADLITVQQHFTNTLSRAPMVPEPAIGALIVLVLGIGIGRRWG